jgi:F-type H+-transporting ATPase subunit a
VDVPGAGTVIDPLLAQFHPPTTKDFVWPCWGGSVQIGGVTFCMNFIFFLVLLSFLAFVLLFFLALRKPKVVPGKLQSIVEGGVQFVRENIAYPMIGPEGDTYMPLLVTLFFFIFLGNLLEIIPGINFSANSRIAFPIVMAVVSWVTFITAGIRKHRFFGFWKHVLFPPGAPAWLYPLLVPIEFFTQIIIRPITLSVRLAANFLAGHFLLAVFFLGSLALFQSGFLAIFGPFAFAIAVVLVGFEFFVAVLQAFIFAILTASYIGGAMAEEH